MLDNITYHSNWCCSTPSEYNYYHWVGNSMETWVLHFRDCDNNCSPSQMAAKWGEGMPPHHLIQALLSTADIASCLLMDPLHSWCCPCILSHACSKCNFALNYFKFVISCFVLCCISNTDWQIYVTSGKDPYKDSEN